MEPKPKIGQYLKCKGVLLGQLHHWSVADGLPGVSVRVLGPKPLTETLDGKWPIVQMPVSHVFVHECYYDRFEFTDEQ